MKDRMVKQVLLMVEYQWEKERVKEGKYGRCTLYTCMRKEQ
jgi:hypothetical protein